MIKKKKSIKRKIISKNHVMSKYSSSVPPPSTPDRCPCFKKTYVVLEHPCPSGPCTGIPASSNILFQIRQRCCASQGQNVSAVGEEEAGLSRKGRNGRLRQDKQTDRNNGETWSGPFQDLLKKQAVKPRVSRLNRCPW